MTYTRRQVFLAFLAGCLLIYSVTGSSAGALFDIMVGVRSISDYFVIGLHVLTLVVSLWMMKQAFTAGIFLTRKRMIFVTVLTALVVLSSLIVLFPQLVVGYLGMPSRYHAY